MSCWDKSKTGMEGTKFKTSNLMSDLRNNLTNAMERLLGLLIGLIWHLDDILKMMQVAATVR